MRLVISKRVLAQIVAHAGRSPHEVCGLLLDGDGDGDGGGVTALPTNNVAADPARRFEVDPVALVGAYRAARGGGPKVLGHYHSHPAGVTTPSPTDAEMALEDGVLWLIVASDRAEAYVTKPGGSIEGRFDRVALVIEG